LEAALKKNYGDKISDIELIPSDGGAYEIKVNGELIYSKLETGQHIEPPAALELFKNYIEE
jgi:selenoprotein W-related protein